jgi:hypothetical protein
MIPHITKQDFALKIVINSMIDDDLEVRRASLKALGSVLCSSDAQLMVTLVDYGYLENITTSVINSND